MFLKKEEARQLLCILKLTLERWSSVATLITATLLRHSTNSTRFYRQREQQQRGNLTLRQWPSFFFYFFGELNLIGNWIERFPVASISLADDDDIKASFIH